MLGAIAWLWLAGPPAEVDGGGYGEFAPVEILAPGQQPEQPPKPEPEAESQAPEPEADAPESQTPEPPPPTLEEEIPDDEDLEEEIPLDEDLEEGIPEDEPYEVIVDASVLGDGNAFDVFTFAGGRTVVGKEEMQERGATNVGEALQRKPGVRTIEGNSGLGSQDTKLQVAVRGVNPRLSGRATVLLDEIPIAPAPYGQPQLSLFPISLFSIADIDVVRGGATARYGPQTSGGVFNLVSNPIPEHPSISVFAQGDSNLDFSLGTAYGGTHGRFGMYLEYAPRFGHSWRERSGKLVHGGLAKFAWQFNPSVRLESISHGYFEDSELPGGLRRDAYEVDPFQSQRPFDFFRGSRFGTALKLNWQINDDQSLKVSGWYSHSYRSTTIAALPGDARPEVGKILTRPREYDVMGVEPRWSLRRSSKRFDFSQQLSVGARAAYELAKMYTIAEEFGMSLTEGDDDARAGAYAGYVSEKLIFLGGDLSVDAGLRLEYIQASRRSNLEQLILYRNYWAPLPSGSLWYAPVDEFALFVAYGRSFGPPTYLQMNVSGVGEQLDPETSNSVELGLKALELGGVYGEITGWYKDFSNFIDAGLENFDAIENIYNYGVESELSWYPGEVWDRVGELELYAGYGWTGSYVKGLTYTGNRMPWYPEHEAWGGASYAFDFGLKFGADVNYTGLQYTDYENRDVESLDAAYGPIPAYTIVNLWARVRAPLPLGWRLEFTGGIKNVADLRYFSRTDDRNAGLLVGRPRTFYVNLGFAHDFLPKHLRPARRKRKQEHRAVAGRTTHAALDRMSGALPF